MASSGAEDSVYQAAKNGLQLWLGRVKDAVLASWREFQAVPNANEVSSTVPIWQAQVDKIIAALTPALIEGWSAAHLPYDFDPQDPYIQANLALTNNLLVRIPDEVHAMIVKEILEGTDAGETTAQIAARVESVLQYTGSENWDGRAQLIAQTETTRHRNSSALAHGLLVEKQDNRILMKRWHTTMDGREREAHKLTNNQVRTLNQPFDVQGVPMLYPGDPTAPPELVCNCRCDVELMPAGR